MELEEDDVKNMYIRKYFEGICGKIGAEKQIRTVDKRKTISFEKV